MLQMVEKARANQSNPIDLFIKQFANSFGISNEQLSKYGINLNK